MVQGPGTISKHELVLKTQELTLGALLVDEPNLLSFLGAVKRIFFETVEIIAN
jgi:hypothetical protein